MHTFIKSIYSALCLFVAPSKNELQEADSTKLSIPNVELLPDSELVKLNKLLPWASYVVDSKSRRFGKAFSARKRSEPQMIPDPRIIELDKRFPLAKSSILEVGCFEGIHTIALAERAKDVTAIDSRIENVVKTLVRCNMFGYKPDVFYLDLEKPLTPIKNITYDILHHVGVLYHLSNPVEHLYSICKQVNTAVMLDTHVAISSDLLKSYTFKGADYLYKEYKEGGRSEPFSGMKEHAKWLLENDLIAILKACEFKNIDVAERREERNGNRVLIFAHR